MEIIKQAFKYGIVGIGNTLLTLIIIWIMTKWLGCSAEISNFTGYIIGIINSFFLNKKWTFKSTVSWKNSAIRFSLVFVICYVMQFALLKLLLHYCPTDPPLYALLSPLLLIFKIDPSFYIQIIAMAFYTVINFIINKFYTFKA